MGGDSGNREFNTFKAQANSDIFSEVNRRLLRIGIWLVMGGGLYLLYFLACFRGIDSAQVMDYAQVARSLYAGKGFVTEFIRPLSLFFVKDISLHPDLFNPPLFPFFLSLFYNLGGVTETVVAFTSSFFFFLSAILTYFLASQIFDKRTAFLSLFLVLASPTFLKLSISGSELNLLVFLFLLLFLSLRYFLNKPSNLSSLGIGFILGLLFLSRYWFWVFLIPTGLFIYKNSLEESLCKLIYLFLGFLGAVFSWGMRNAYLTGNPLFTLSTLGLNSFLSGKPLDEILRSPYIYPFHPHFFKIIQRYFANFSFSYSTFINLSGNFISSLSLFAFFWIFKAEKLPKSLLKWFFFILGIHFILSGVSSEIAQQLIVYLPFIVIAVSALFWELLEYFKVSAKLSKIVTSIFIFVNILPLFLDILSPNNKKIDISSRKNASYLQSVVKKDEFVLSDVPWRVAWLGSRKSIWLPLSVREIEALTKELKEEAKGMKFVYLTRGVLSISGPDSLWRRIYLKGEFPEDFLYKTGVLLPQGEMLLGTSSFKLPRDKDEKFSFRG